MFVRLFCFWGKMETAELIRLAQKRDLSRYDNAELYLDAVRLETDFAVARPHFENIYDIACRQKVRLAKTDTELSIKFYELAKKAALCLAPHLFHYYLLYVEWDRLPEKKFYVPRMHVLKRVVDSLQRLEERKLKRLAISMPTRTGKSTLGMFFMSWVAGRHPLGSSALTGYSDTLTNGFLDEILGIISDPEYLWADVFPTCQIANISRENGSFCLNKRRRFATITCRGIEAAWTGAIDVTDILYCDDLIKDFEEACNERRLAAKYNAYLNQTKDRKKDRAVELHIGTRWAVNDVIGRLQVQYADDPQSEFLVLPALDENNESNFKYAYGVGFSTEYYLDIKESLDPCTWSCKYMGDPYVREGLVFERDSLNYYNGVLPDGQCDIMSAVDVAWGGGDSLSAPIIYWYGDVGYVHDWVFSNGGKTVTQPLICSAFSKNNVARARFEANVGGTEYAEETDSQLRAQGYKMNITTQRASTKSSKMDKIIRWSEDIKNKLYFRSDSGRGEMYDKAMNELCRFSMDAKKQHDDAPDSLAMCMDFRFNGLSQVQIIERRW